MEMPHTHELGEGLGRCRLADEIIELYRCRHCRRLLVKSEDEDTVAELRRALPQCVNSGRPARLGLS
jgi:hypothetical protein